MDQLLLHMLPVAQRDGAAHLQRDDDGEHHRRRDVPAALALSQWASSQLFGLSPSDPLTLMAAAVTLAGVGAAAGYLPARRAAAVEPVTALRSA